MNGEEMSLKTDQGSVRRESNGPVPRPHSIAELYGSTPVDSQGPPAWNQYSDLPLASEEEGIERDALVDEPPGPASQSVQEQAVRAKSVVPPPKHRRRVSPPIDDDSVVSVPAQNSLNSADVVPIDNYRDVWQRAANLAVSELLFDPAAEFEDDSPNVAEQFDSPVASASPSASDSPGIGLDSLAIIESQLGAESNRVRQTLPEMESLRVELSLLPDAPQQVELSSGLHSRLSDVTSADDEPLIAEIADSVDVDSVDVNHLQPTSLVESRREPVIASPKIDNSSLRLEDRGATSKSPFAGVERDNASEPRMSSAPERSSRLRDLKLRLDIPRLETRSTAKPQIRRFEEQLLANINDASKSQQYQQLATTIQNQFPTESHATVLIVGCEMDLKFSETVATLGTYLAESMGRDCLLVDAMQGASSLSSRFDQAKASGFADLIAGRHEWKELVLRTYFNNLTLLPAGRCAITKNSQTAPDTARLLESIKRLHRYTLLAAGESPLTPLLGRICDVTYLVVQLGATESQQATETVAQLRSSGARVLGCVVLGDED
ncbi:MAG: Mrp family chromosome partitioning ATPase [Pirellulaceae bacterium]|jgi:Mrp family chromosome partitioning ATPase